MKWFKRWSTVRSESQNKSSVGENSENVKNGKNCDHHESIKCNDNSISNVSCSKDNTNEPSCSGIKLHDPKAEILHPDEFFQDPEHIRQYKEEAEFLNMISEWEIINFTDIPASYYHLNTQQECKKQVKKQNKKKKGVSDEKQSRTRSSPSTSSTSDCPLLLPTTPKVMKDIKPVAILTKSKDDELYASNDDFVHIERTPSVLSLTSYDEDHYGLFESQYTIPEDQPPEAIYPGFLWNDIQPGLKIKSSNAFVSNSHANLLFEALIIDPLQTDEDQLKTEDASDPKRSLTNLNLSTKSNSISSLRDIDDKSSTINAISKSLMGALMTPNSILSNIQTYNITEDADDDTSSSVNDTNKHSKPISYSHKKSTNHDINVAKLFSLNDDGDILVNMNHINIEIGCGFLMRRSKNVYKIIKSGIEVDENYKTKLSVADFLKNLLKLLRDVLFGHPRNKAHSGGPGDSVGSYTLQLANDHTSTFSRNIENFIACTKESREAAPQVVMRNMRQFMSGMKNYLVKHGEGDFQQEVQKARSRLKPDEFLNLDAILEAVMHQLVVLPLREHLYGMFVDYYTRSGDIQLLVENVKYACARNPADFGIQPSVTPPTSMALHQISLLLLRLQEAELPLEKLELFLLVISAIFDATGCPRGQQLGADDFLPILVFVVAKCGFVGAEIEAEFMWGLLQPPLLSGEAGYYLTALCSAVHVLKSFMASDSEGTGSLDWRSSSLPACSSVLRVIIPDECNGSLQTRTLPVRPHTTTREVCRIIAHRARITNPQDYGLFKLVDGEETLLADSECPQDARIAARGKHCMLAYKRIDAKIAWPTSTTASYS